MRHLIKLLLALAGIFFIFLVHTLLIYLLPYPANRLNFLFIILLWLIIYKNDPLILWLALPLSLTTELFSSLPFGLSTAALLIGLFLEHWLLLNIFTNHSWYIVLLCGFTALLSYRLLFLIFISGANLFKLTSYSFQWSLFSDLLVEGAINAGALTILYLLSRSFSKRLNPRYVDF